jgi:hypothetical protein
MQLSYWASAYAAAARDVVPFVALEAAALKYGFVIEEEEPRPDGCWYTVTRKKSGAAAAAADEA